MFSPSHYSNIDYNKIKKIVEAEKEFRAEMDLSWDILTQRLATLEQFGEEMAGDIMVNKPILFDKVGGKSHNRPTKPQTLAQLHPGGKAEIERLLVMIKPNRRHSIWKQKFYTYVFNRDKANAIKYHDKLHKYEMDSLEELYEEVEADGEVFCHIDNTINNEDDIVCDGEGSYLRTANAYKKSYETRKKLIELM